MARNEQEQIPEIELDRNELYREETISDRRAGTITRLTPIKIDGSRDNGREELYIGQAQMLTPVGTIPLSFALEAKSLEGAIDKFPQAAKAAIERTLEELKELRRETASGIVIPERGAGTLGGPGGGRGAMPGGGKIQLR
jgi:regulator of protease activity HflC (stomatin/prohibitin superfamily)